MARARTLVRERRNRLGLKQQELAAMLGVSQQTIARWEGGAEIPSKYLKDLAIVLLCRAEDLIQRDPQEAVAASRVVDRSRDTGYDVPYGTARLVWIGSDIDPHEESEVWLPTQYPISEGEMKRLYSRLNRRDDHASWFIFETLDYRVVIVNRQQLEVFSMVSETAEEMPPFDHEEVYKALSDIRMRDILERGVTPAQPDDEQAPYSETLIKRCRELVEEWGGFQQIEDRVVAITFETIGGHRESIWLDDRGFEEIAGLEFEIDTSDDHDSAPMSDWMVDLFSEGYDRSTLYRLGSLRLIEVPLLQSRAAHDRLFAD